ncbi:MAG TPA: leucine-rich repeat domain-containing protein, partial [Clostridia bacterium]|nr:leucine-rich repeat domain-containing protein [Clostridia bacterium]
MGYGHGAAIKADGTVWTWGWNGCGQLGTGIEGDVNTPREVVSGVAWKSIVACGAQTLGVKKDGTLWAWGNNEWAQLGDAALTNHNMPRQVGTSDMWAELGTGGSTSYAIQTNGTIWAWGANFLGQVGDGTTETRSTPVQVLPRPLAITDSGALPLACKGVSYRANLQVTGGMLPYTWAVETGSLPPGLSLSAQGELTGTPAQDGKYDFSLRVTDGTSASQTVNLSLKVINQGVLVQELYLNVPGSKLSELISHPTFPGSPDIVSVLSSFETAFTGRAYYGERISGFLVPPQSGNYVFYLCSDDESLLYLSTDANPLNKVQIAHEPTWNNPREWGFAANNQYDRGNPPSNVSSPISLEAGRPYYVEVLHKQHNGGDNVGVAWQLPGAAAPTNGAPPIASQFFGLQPGQALSQTLNFVLPAQLFTTDSPVTLSATASSGLPVTFEVVSGPAFVSGSELILNGPGYVTVRAIQTGNEQYMPAFAEQTVQVMTPSQIVAFLDPILEARVSSTLGIPTGSITAADMLSLTNLWAEGLGITNLSGLEWAFNATHITAGVNQISDFGPLAGLTNLVHLSLWYNQASDLSPLANLGNLQMLWLGWNHLTSVDALTNLSKLETLVLNATQISDLAPLAALTNLVHLDFGLTLVTNAAPLSGLTKLQYLGTTGNHFSDLRLVAHWPDLRFLFADYNDVIDLSPLALCPNLTEVYLEGNQVTDLAPLASLTNLTRLNIGGNRSPNIDVLTNLTKLVWLRLEGNHLASIDPVAGLTNLVDLGFWDNQVTDITPLANLTRLQFLDFSYNQVTSLAPLANCGELRYFWAHRNRISDLTPLAGLSHLGLLYLEVNRITSVEPLAGLANLFYVNVSSNMLNVSPGSPSLETINNWVARGVNVNYEGQLSAAPQVAFFSGRADGFTYTITNAGPTLTLDTNSIALALDQVSVPINSISYTAPGRVVVSYIAAPDWLASGSSHVATIRFASFDQIYGGATNAFYVESHVAIPTEFRAAQANTAQPGFRVRPYQTIGGQTNGIAWTELQLAGKQGLNVANLAGTDSEGYFDVPGVIDYDIDTNAAWGHFNAPQHPPSMPPGIPGTTGSMDNFAQEIVSWLYFPTAGIYTMGVRSDDGFKVSTAANPRDPNGLVLAQFEGGWGANDTFFTFAVSAAGYYPFRLIWESGGGGASCEWFMMLPDGRSVLINDPSEPDAIRAYRSGSAPPFVKAFNPVLSGFAVELVDGSDPVVDASIQTDLNNSGINPAIERYGSLVKVICTQPSPLPYGSSNSADLYYTDFSGRKYTNTFAFTVGGAHVDAGLAVAPELVDKTQRGFLMRPFKTMALQPNSLEFAEQQLAGMHGPNIADISASNQGWFTNTGAINYAFGIPDAGSFQSLNGYPEQCFPGVSQYGASVNNSALEVLTFIEFPSAGTYTLGVNSGDGFKVTVGQNPRDSMALT